MFDKFKTENLSLYGILSLAWQIFWRHIGFFLLVTLLVYLPINFLLSFLPFDIVASRLGEEYAYRAYMQANQLLHSVFGILAVIAVVHFVDCLWDDKPCTLREACRYSGRQWWPVIWVSILSKLAIIGFTLLLIIPGIIYAGYYIFVLYAVIIEDQRGLKALGFSKALVKGRWWKVIGYSIVIALCGMVGYFVFGFVAVLLEGVFAGGVILDTAGGLFSIFTLVGMTLFFKKLVASMSSSTPEIK